MPLELFKDMMAEYDGDVEWSSDMLSDVEWAAGNSLVYVAYVRARGSEVNYNAVKSDIDKKKNKCDPLLKPLDYEEWKTGGREIFDFLEANYFDSEGKHDV